MSAVKNNKLNSVAVIGNYLPRQCGIATFTADLCGALAEELDSGAHVAAVAMDDLDGGYAYPRRVKFQIRDHWLPDYLKAADFLNVNQFDVAILQHEFGIFGGKDGSHILRLVKNLNMPLITTLHTILDEPSDEQRKIVLDLAKYSEKVVVMSKNGRDMLRQVYGIEESRIAVIHHGIPDVGFMDPYFHKDTFGVKDKKVILTFGLIHPGKGIEYVLNAMPEIIEKHPDVVYIVLGATHPNVLKATGDAYRQSLLQLVNRLNLKDHVLFKNQFVELDELCEYIGAADIYITPYLSEKQIVSGALAYAVGAGKAVISTPYWYAEEILSSDRGRLVAFRDADGIAREVNDLLANEQERNAVRKRAYQFGRMMVWSKVAVEYISRCVEVIDYRAEHQKDRPAEKTYPKGVDELPAPKLDHLRTMTDDTGVLQHCYFSIPDRNHGYCVDDNARALIVSSLHYSLYKDENSVSLTKTYLSFLHHAFNTGTGRFRNFMSYDRRWLDEEGSEDSHGRALWGVGTAVKHAPNDSLRNMATRLFQDGVDAVERLTYPRALAFSLIGIHAYLEVFNGDAAVRRLRKVTAKKLYDRFKGKSDKEWPWYEDEATYANARIPHALLLSGQWIPDDKMWKKGIELLQWLLDRQTSPQGHLSIIGNQGWMKRDRERAHFDQQPIEAMTLLDACAEVYRSTGEEKWLNEAMRCLNWFLGYNDLHVPLNDFITGGCFDGLQMKGVNRNQGAESSLAWLISILTIFEVMGRATLLKNGSG
ncbi:MAG: glycosyltransferase family 4 protein [Desulfobacterales bacterium]|nr:glycosyltransferase family 4 protein [Desulfobacterales bacterium]